MDSSAAGWPFNDREPDDYSDHPDHPDNRVAARACRCGHGRDHHVGIGPRCNVAGCRCRRYEAASAATPRVWVPDRRWTTEPEIIDGKRCRMKVGKGPTCRRPAVAALARRNGWWCYCEEHLYGRKIEDGVVLVEVAAGSPAAERGFTQ